MLNKWIALTLILYDVQELLIEDISISATNIGYVENNSKFDLIYMFCVDITT